jgi:WD40 repeat protein
MLSELEEYTLLALPAHLSQAGRAERLCELLFNFNFLSSKVAQLGPYPIIQDYNLAYPFERVVGSHVADGIRLIQQALQLSAHVLQTDHAELPSQLFGRLLNQTHPAVRKLLDQAEGESSGVWLRPLKASLGEPGGPLLSTLSGHLQHITAIEFTTDSRYCLSADYGGALKLWDVESGNELATLPGNKEGARAIAVTPDGRRLVTATWDHRIHVWDLKARSLLKELSSPPYPVSVAVAADCKYAVSNADKHKTLKVWDLERGTRLPSLRGHAGEVQDVRVIPGRPLFISASCDKTCKVWDIIARRQVATLAGHSGRVEKVSVTPDGRYAVSQSEGEWRLNVTPDGRDIFSQSPGELKVWDLVNFSEVTTIPQASLERLIGAVRRPTGEYFIYTSMSSAINVRNLVTGLKVGSISSTGRNFNDARVSPDGKYIISAADKNLRIWDAAVDAEVRVGTFPGVDSFNTVGVTPDGRYALSISDRSNIKSWDLGKCFEPADITNLSKQHTPAIDLDKFKPASDNLLIQQKDMWRSSTSRWREAGWKEPFPFVENSDFLSCLAFTPDSEYAVVGSQIGTVLLLNLSEPEESKLISPRKRDDPNIVGMESANAVTITPDGRHIVSGYDKGIRVWDTVKLAEGKLRARLLKGHLGVVTAVVALPDAEHLISGSYDGHLMLWHVKRHAPVCYLFHTDKAVTALVITPSGRELFVGLIDGTIIKWDLKSDERHSWRGHKGAVAALKVTPGGRFVLSVSDDNTLKLWDTENTMLLAGFSGDSELTGVDITPDGLTVIGCSSLGQLHVLRVMGTQLTSISPGNNDTISPKELLDLKGVRIKIHASSAAASSSAWRRSQPGGITVKSAPSRQLSNSGSVAKGLFIGLGGMPMLLISKVFARGLTTSQIFCGLGAQTLQQVDDALPLTELIERELQRINRQSKFSPISLSPFLRRDMGRNRRASEGMARLKEQTSYYLTCLSRGVNDLCHCGSGKKYKNCCQSR